MCYHSKYREAIPLRKVDAISVAEAMVEIFSCTGIPSEILTDQGSIFVGSLKKQLCLLLNIKPIRTSPYNPQTDGMLEHWHASVKGMIKKSEIRKVDWISISSLCLHGYPSYRYRI